MKKSFKERFRYWFDAQMDKGTSRMLLMLSGAVLLIIVLISVILYLIEGDNLFLSFWDVFSTTINAWMPASEDGGIAYLILVSLSAIIGLLFTSFVIGIVTSFVEEKLSALRKGNSVVIEKNHIVVLGFQEGEYTLISQLMNSAEDEKLSIVVAAEKDKEEMEEALEDNLEIPSNVKIICRNADITSPTALECCSLESAGIIIVNPIDDKVTVKTLLAVSKVLEENDCPDVRVVTAVSNDDYIFPYHIRKQYGFVMLRINDIIARIIAHSCEQPGLSEAFMEVFDYMGNEFYPEEVPEISGKHFKDIFYYMEHAVPIGIYRDGQTILNPERDTILKENDRLIVFEKAKGAYHLSDTYFVDEDKKTVLSDKRKVPGKVLILGNNDKLSGILKEMPSGVKEVVIGDTEAAEELASHGRVLRNDIRFSTSSADPMNLDELKKMISGCTHVIVLSNCEIDEEDSDIRTTMLTLKLRELKETLKQDFSMTVEMRKEENRTLLMTKDATDFIVSSNMSSMVLTQVALTPELYDTFHELLSNEGSEFVLKNADFAECVGSTRTIAELRRNLIHKRCILLGYIDYDEKGQHLHLNPELDKELVLKAEDKLIVLEADE